MANPLETYRNDGGDGNDGKLRLSSGCTRRRLMDLTAYASMSERPCPWCGSSFTPRTSGGKAQRFCSPRCRREHEAGLQAWAREQEAAGRVTKADLQRARSSGA